MWTCHFPHWQWNKLITIGLQGFSEGGIKSYLQNKKFGDQPAVDFQGMLIVLPIRAIIQKREKLMDWRSQRKLNVRLSLMRHWVFFCVWRRGGYQRKERPGAGVRQNRSAGQGGSIPGWGRKCVGATGQRQVSLDFGGLWGLDRRIQTLLHGCSKAITVSQAEGWHDENSFTNWVYSSDFPGGTVIKTWEMQVRPLGQEDPLEKEMTTTPVFLPGKLHGQWSLVSYSPWCCKESDMTEHAHTCSNERISSRETLEQGRPDWMLKQITEDLEFKELFRISSLIFFLNLIFILNHKSSPNKENWTFLLSQGVLWNPSKWNLISA